MAVLLLVPGVAAAQYPVGPQYPLNPLVQTPTAVSTDLILHTPPPPTIPTAPELVLPVRPSPTSRPVAPFNFRPTLGISEEYSDNFNRTSQNPVSNFRSAIFPGFEARLDTGFLTGQAVYMLSAFHDSSVGEVGVHHWFAGQLDWQVTSRFKLSISDTFTQSDNPYLADRIDLRLNRQKYTSNLLGVGAEYSFNTVDLKGYYRMSIFDSDPTDTTTNTIGTSAAIQLGRIHTLTLGYEYLNSQTDAPGANTTTTGHQLTGSFSRDLNKNLTAGVTATLAFREQSQSTGTTDFTRWSLAAFGNYVLSNKIILRGSVGLAQLDSDDTKPRLLFTTDTDLSYYLGPAVLGLRLERGFSESFAQGQNLGVIETFGVAGSVLYRFTPLLTSSGIISYRDNKFTGLGGGQAGQEDKVLTVSANVSYQILRWLTATLDYTYTHATSNAPQGGFSENRVRAALNAVMY